MKLRVIVHPEPEGGYWAEVPELPGCVTEGDTYEELMANLRDAITGVVQARLEIGLRNAEVSKPHEFEIAV